jgi:hypothetical protein
MKKTIITDHPAVKGRFGSFQNWQNHHSYKNVGENFEEKSCRKKSKEITKIACKPWEYHVADLYQALSERISGTCGPKGDQAIERGRGEHGDDHITPAELYPGYPFGLITTRI